jgi:flagellar hook-associated protein 3 FlgL
MLPLVNGRTDSYLKNLSRIQSTMDTIQRQLSSGTRVGMASDDPSAVPSILQDQSRIAAINQTLTNLDTVKTELESGDSALQQAVKLVDQAIALATQASQTGLSDSSKFPVLADQVKTIHQQLVDLSRTTVNGRYIFSGDLDQQALYAENGSQPTGVQQLATATSTRAITDADGATIWTSPTATDIFDARQPDTSPAPGNVFAAITSLLTALQNNDASAATATIDSLKASDDHLNQQLGLYGIAQTRVADSADSAHRSLVTATQDLGKLRDTDTAAAAVELSQITLQQQAAWNARSKTSQMSLFDYLA